MTIPSSVAARAEKLSHYQIGTAYVLPLIPLLVSLVFDGPTRLLFFEGCTRRLWRGLETLTEPSLGAANLRTNCIDPLLCEMP